jgi:hypothetical protein
MWAHFYCALTLALSLQLGRKVSSFAVCALCPCCPVAVWPQRFRVDGAFLHVSAQISGFLYPHRLLPGLCEDRCFLRTRVHRQCSWVLHSGIVVWFRHYLVLCNLTVGYRMSKRVLVFGCKVVICCEGTAWSSFLTASAFFLYLSPSSSRFFLTWAFHRSLVSTVMPR